MSFTIVTDENIPGVERFFGAIGRVVQANGRALTHAQVKDADILLVRSVTRVDEALLDGSRVRFVGTATSGIDHVDRDYLARNHIAFAYTPGANANSVVEYVLAAVAAVDDKLERLLGGEFVGIVGYGHIGRALAARLQALGIGCRVYDPWLDQHTVDGAADLESVLDCDVVSLHPELCIEQPWPSHHLLGQDELLRMHPGALLINASRGAVVDNRALLARLVSGQALCTVLDVWEGEPNINPALLARVALGTAHIAGYSLDGKLLATRMLRDAVMTSLNPTSRPGLAESREGVIAPALPPLRVAHDLSGAAVVRFLLQSHYDIRADDAMLRMAVTEKQAEVDRGRRFDQLRRLYRERRELAGSVVKGAGPAQEALVRALGCVPFAR